MRPVPSMQLLRIFWPHWVGGAFFVALYALQLIYVLPGRPTEPDPANGYTIEFKFDPDPVYVSVQDLVLFYGTLLIAALIVTTGIFRLRMAQRSNGQG